MAYKDEVTVNVHYFLAEYGMTITKGTKIVKEYDKYELNGKTMGGIDGREENTLERHEKPITSLRVDTSHHLEDFENNMQIKPESVATKFKT